MKNTTKLFLTLAIIGICGNLFAENTTMYYLSGVPQSHYLNPATQPECNLYIGIPMLSSSHIELYNNAITINDILYADPESDSVIHPLYSENAKQRFLQNFKEDNKLSIDAAISLISFGFRLQEYYIALDVTLRTSQQFHYPKDFAVFMLDGNITQPNFDFQKMGMNFHNHTEYGLTVSRNFGDQLSVGVKPKLLFGVATVNSSARELSLETEPLSWRLNADYDMRVSLPGMVVPVDEDGVYDSDGELEFDPEINSTSEYIKLATSNPGWGIDVGAHYKPIDRLQLSLSLLDLGYIKWKSYTHTVSLNGSYEFKGLEVNIGDSSNFTETIWDTIKSNLNVTGSDETFTTYLNPKLYVGGRFFITGNLDVGLLSRTEFINSTIEQDLSILANWRPSHIFNLSASYNFLNAEKQPSLGLGMSFALGPINSYIIYNNIPTSYNTLKINEVPLPLPNDTHSYNVRIGLNLVFGCNRMKKLMKDKPLLYRSDYLE